MVINVPPLLCQRFMSACGRMILKGATPFSRPRRADRGVRGGPFDREVRAQGKALHAVAQDALRQGFVNERQVERLLEGYQELLITAKRLV